MVFKKLVHFSLILNHIIATAMSRFDVSDEIPGVNGQLKVVLSDKVTQQTCDVHLWGCTVTSWKSHGIEKLFLSELAIFDGKKAVRGGIPLVFPQFGQPNVSMPQHGFARTSLWSFKEALYSSDECSAIFTLSENEETLALWPHKFTLTYTVSMSATGLRTKLDIENAGDMYFECQALLHTYIRVSDIHSTQVFGFQDSQYLDKMTPEITDLQTDEREFANFDKEVDRIYQGSDSPFGITLKDSKPCTAEFNNEILHITCESSILIPTPVLTNTTAAMVVAGTTDNNQDGAEGSNSSGPVLKDLPTDCVLWNAWINKTASIGDLNNDAYLQYVCVEPGVVKEAVSVQPGETLSLSQMLWLPLA